MECGDLVSIGISSTCTASRRAANLEMCPPPHGAAVADDGVGTDAQCGTMYPRRVGTPRKPSVGKLQAPAGNGAGRLQGDDAECWLRVACYGRPSSSPVQPARSAAVRPRGVASQHGR